MSMLKNGLVSAAVSLRRDRRDLYGQTDVRRSQNGLKMLGRNPGRFDRLGGEFVFDVDEGTACRTVVFPLMADRLPSSSNRYR
jgi:hypothetical protein